MKILGICPDVWISSAVLIDDGKIIAAGAEERFIRQKMSKNFPTHAIKYCLSEAKCKLEDIDYTAVGWNPGAHLKRLNSRFSSTARWRAEYLYSVPNQLLALSQDKQISYVTQHFKQARNQNSVIYVPHHLAHAANAFYPSPFKKAAILTIDGRGEDDTALWAIGDGHAINEIKTAAFPHSLGLLYGTVTEFLGFQPDADEWKVMALASSGQAHNEYYKKLKKIVKFLPEGMFELDLSYFSYYLHDQLHFYTDKLVALFGAPRDPEARITKRHEEIAAALQQISEEVATHMLNWLHVRTKSDNVVVGGGFFMNSVFNGKITKVTPFKNVFISSCPDDSGTSIGAALYAYHHILNNRHRQEMVNNYYGPQFNNQEIKAILEKYKVPYIYIKGVEEEAARLISKGNIVGWFQGRMEFGQRALGNRSILADPRKKEMKDKVNSVVKYRESFRPFAPSILTEYVHDYFDCPREARVPFMEKVYMIKPAKRRVIPAVTHIDGSGRLQTVDHGTNSRYYRLIKAFSEITGVPVVLNTSFNLKGEPIVCTPTDALRTFYTCGLDALILGNYLIKKV